jgi:RNA polymerase sigma-70 factor, ECF subfamily
MSRDDAGYDLLFATEYAAVMRTVYLIVHDLDRAEDIAQDAFLQLLRHWRKVSRYDRPGAWVRRVAIRLATDLLKRERLRSILERRAAPATEGAPPEIDVLGAVRRLAPNQRAAVVLFYFEDRPVAEVADIMGCAWATARVHLHRGRQRLAELLEEEVSEDVAGRARQG